MAACARRAATLKRQAFLGGVAAVTGMVAGAGLAPREVMAQTMGRPILPTSLRRFDGRTMAIREGVCILVAGDVTSGLAPRGQGPEEAPRVDRGCLRPSLLRHRHRPLHRGRRDMHRAWPACQRGDGADDRPHRHPVADTAMPR
jgi:hypothetical protein